MAFKASCAVKPSFLGGQQKNPCGYLHGKYKKATALGTEVYFAQQ